MAKKYAGGGFVGAAGTNRGSWSGDGELGVRTGTRTGTTASNRVESKPGRSTAPGLIRKANKPSKPAAKAAPAAPKKPNYNDVVMFKKPGTGTNWPGQANRNPGAPGTANPEGKGDREMRRGGVVRKTFSKKMDAEERKEFKKGKYTGGPAEEKAEKGKRMALGGTASVGTGRPGRRLGQQKVEPGMRMGQRSSRTFGPGKRAAATTKDIMPSTTSLPASGPSRMDSSAMIDKSKLKSGPSSATDGMSFTQPGVSAPLKSPPNDMSFTQPGVSVGGTVSSPANPPPSRGGVTSSSTNPYIPSGYDPSKGQQLNAPTKSGTTPEATLVSSAQLPRGGMRGGGLAKKGVGQALAKGGLVKGAGCASRGVKKPRYC